MRRHAAKTTARPSVAFFPAPEGAVLSKAPRHPPKKKNPTAALAYLRAANTASAGGMGLEG